MDNEENYSGGQRADTNLEGVAMETPVEVKNVYQPGTVPMAGGCGGFGGDGMGGLLAVA